MLEEIKKINPVHVIIIVFVLAVVFLGNTTTNSRDVAQVAQAQGTYDKDYVQVQEEERRDRIDRERARRETLPKRTLFLDNDSCRATIKSGWNLVNIGDLMCGFAQIQNGKTIDNFPAYLNMWVYDGNKYIYAKITRRDVQNRSIGQSVGPAIGPAIIAYANNFTKKFTRNEFSDFERFVEDRVIRDIEQGNEGAIKKYAGVLAGEVFTSVWVYNPGQNINIEYFPSSSQYDEETASIALKNLLFGSMSSSDFSKLINYIENEVLDELLREVEREGKGYLSFMKGVVSGEVTIDRGWNFLSYSKVLANDNGYLEFKNGNCNITKAYLFDNNAKKWVNVIGGSVSGNRVGSGMVVYNSANTCNLIVKNNILKTFSNLLSDGSAITPPPLPN